MTTKLKLYKAALRIAGERTIADLTEDREPRRVLDEIWDDGGVDYCLERGQWKFAMRTVRLDYDPSIAPEFGYQYAFAKPSDWILTSAQSTDEYFNVPLLQVVDENGYWYCDNQELYVRYVSNGANYGSDLTIWTTSFAEYAAHHFARKLVYRLTADKQRRDQVMEEEKKALLDAMNHDSMADPTKFPPQGAWTGSRRWGRRERGNKNSLKG
jgi:hypothetical protein